MKFKGKDFNANKPRRYEGVRGLMVKTNESYATPFGPADIPNIRTDAGEDEIERIKEGRRTGSEKIKQGYKRIMEKIKKIRQGFSHAVTNGRRSGSGKIELEHYDTLTNLFSGSATVEPITFCLESSSSSISTNINSPAIYLEVENNCVGDDTNDVSGSILADVERNSSTSNTSYTPRFNNKRKGDDENCVPRLIDSKRRHLEKKLSQSQRDEILLKETKEEGLFKMELGQAIKDSNKVFADAMSDMSKSFMLIAETMKISKQQMAMIQHPQQRQHSLVAEYQPGHHSHLYSAQQAQQRSIFHTMSNAHQPKIMSTPPQTVSINAPPLTMNAPQQTLNSQKDATSATCLSSLRDFQ